MPSTFEGENVLTADVTMPREGVWHADVVSVGSEVLTGQVTLNLEGVEFHGTVLRSGVNGGRVETKVLGGKGLLPTVITAKDYSSTTTVRGVVRDILREAGETLSGTSEDAVLGRPLNHWERSSGPASRCLRDVLEKVPGATWRVLADGTVWVGLTSWPTASPDYTSLDEDYIHGVLTVATSRPALDPGTTFLGHRISFVTHRVRPESFRTEASLVDSPGNLLERVLQGVRREIDFSRSYPCRVVSQRADGSLELLPDDELLKGRGLDKIAIHSGLPATVKVSPNARCDVAFSAGDPARPYVHGWESPSALEIALGGGALSVGRQGDVVTLFLDHIALNLIAMALTNPAIGGFAVAAPAPQPVLYIPAAINPATLPVAIQAYGVISSGSPVVKSI